MFSVAVQKDVPMAMYTWFQLGGSAEYFAEPDSWETLGVLLREASGAGIPVRLLGSGSNVLVRDAGVSGLVLRAGENLPYQVEVEGNCITVSGNLPLGRLVTSAVYAGLGGIEDMIGIPGTVGGGLHGNAGTNAVDIGRYLKRAAVVAFDGTVTERGGTDLVFGYRQSSLDDCIIREATFELHQDNRVELARRMQRQWIVRRAVQPMGHQCTGRIFKNATESGMNANEIIESAGLKGTRIGGAVVCDRHANYLVTEPECTADDVLRLIDFIREEVERRTGVELELELEIW